MGRWADGGSMARSRSAPTSPVQPPFVAPPAGFMRRKTPLVTARLYIRPRDRATARAGQSAISVTPPIKPSPRPTDGIARRRRHVGPGERSHDMSSSSWFGSRIGRAVVAATLLLTPVAAHARGERLERRGDRNEARGERKEMKGERNEVKGERKQERGARQVQKGERQEQRAQELAAEGRPGAAAREEAKAQHNIKQGEHKEVRGERQEVRGERQEARGEHQQARGERQEARGEARAAR
jgi:hypothetical protein